MEMSHTRIYLVRHGQVEGFEEKRYNGQADVALTALGHDQYRQLAGRLAAKPLAAVYSSDLSRCLEGARLLAEPHGLVPEAFAELRELNIGHWEGQTWKELQARYPAEWQARLADLENYRVPGGESARDMAERALPVIRQLAERHRGQEILVVGHGGLNRVILLDVIGAPFKRLFHIEQNFGCLNIIDYYADGIAVVKLLNG
ncbi:alpha-ribazole phosphatase [Desulfuromonas versatilis]|uniref:Alpha-ribazole phosphatase n=1 Tax=Desulfuromonas versatilis TaxID=2802975 RepID=A0ABM8HPT3_9BACT|nr:alpha-ribazole phosphatase [Desulfuromonas versatilis]BCR03734.1 alpha-ribazole phosphatase [Desulfuromonas versatilis]